MTTTKEIELFSYYRNIDHKRVFLVVDVYDNPFADKPGHVVVKEWGKPKHKQIALPTFHEQIAAGQLTRFHPQPVEYLFI